MNTKITLTELPQEQTGIIDRITDNKLRTELLRFGITGESEVEPLMYSPIGKTRAYFFSSFIIALRSEDSDKILLRSANGGVSSE